MYTTKISHAISDIRKERWDAIAPDPFLTYGWLQTVEKTYIGNMRPTYHMVWDRDMLVGATVCYIVEKDERLFTIDNYLFGRFEKYATRLGISFLPVFFCGSLTFDGEHVLIDNNRDMNERETIMNILLDTIEIEAKRHNLPICFSHITDGECRLAGLLKNRNYNHTVILPFYYLDIEWSSFDGYLNSLKRVNKKRRSTVIHEINRNKKEGVHIDILKEADKYDDRLYELINDNYYKHNNLPVYFKRNYLSELKKNLGNDCLIYASWKNNMITGCSILLKKNGIGHIPLMGVDREQSKNDKTYFNICYYHPIRYAISNRLKKLKLGMGMHEIKSKRGCMTGNLYVYYKVDRKISNLAVKIGLALISKRYRKKRSIQENMN